MAGTNEGARRHTREMVSYADTCRRWISSKSYRTENLQEEHTSFKAETTSSPTSRVGAGKTGKEFCVEILGSDGVVVCCIVMET